MKFQNCETKKLKCFRWSPCFRWMVLLRLNKSAHLATCEFVKVQQKQEEPRYKFEISDSFTFDYSIREEAFVETAWDLETVLIKEELHVCLLLRTFMPPVPFFLPTNLQLFVWKPKLPISSPARSSLKIILEEQDTEIENVSMRVSSRGLIAVCLHTVSFSGVRILSLDGRVLKDFESQKLTRFYNSGFIWSPDSLLLIFQRSGQKDDNVVLFDKNGKPLSIIKSQRLYDSQVIQFSQYSRSGSWILFLQHPSNSIPIWEEEQSRILTCFQLRLIQNKDLLIKKRKNAHQNLFLEWNLLFTIQTPKILGFGEDFLTNQLSLFHDSQLDLYQFTPKFFKQAIGCATNRQSRSS